MAELHVQPKKTTNKWIWILLGLIALVVLFLLMRGCNPAKDDTTANNAADTSATAPVATTSPTAGTDNAINFDSPEANYEEITDKDINVRGNNEYAIYSLGQNVLFDVDKSIIRSDAEAKLKQIAASLSKRYTDSDIQIYGHTDATGDASHNKTLAEQRAEAVKAWIVKNASVNADHITIHPEGEAHPVASNATEEGKQENRSVQIVAKKR